MVEYEKSVFTTDNLRKKMDDVDENAEAGEDDDSENELEKVVSDKIDSFRVRAFLK